jgi:hypothetical protein
VRYLGILAGISVVIFGVLVLALFFLGLGLFLIVFLGGIGTTCAFYAWLGCRIGLITSPEAGCTSLLDMIWSAFSELFAELNESGAEQTVAAKVMAAVSEETPVATVEASADNGFVTSGTLVWLITGTLVLCIVLWAYYFYSLESHEVKAAEGVNVDREELHNILRIVDNIAEQVDRIENKVNHMVRKVDDIAMKAEIYDGMAEYNF